LYAILLIANSFIFQKALAYYSLFSYHIDNLVSRNGGYPEIYKKGITQKIRRGKKGGKKGKGGL